MDAPTPGLVLRTFRYSETSLIVHWITPEAGRLATLAKGALRPKSPFRGKLDFGHLAQFAYRRSSRSDLHTLIEAEVTDYHPGIRRDLDRLNQAAYAAALVQQNTETETPLPEFFDLLVSFFGFLSIWSGPAPLATLAFELKFLDLLGLAPGASPGRRPKAFQDWIQPLTESDWFPSAALPIPAEDQTALARFLHAFLTYHLDRLPQSRHDALNGIQ